VGGAIGVGWDEANGENACVRGLVPRSKIPCGPLENNQRRAAGQCPVLMVMDLAGLLGLRSVLFQLADGFPKFVGCLNQQLRSALKYIRALRAMGCCAHLMSRGAAALPQTA
jgi:hypothetical protein